MQSTRLIIVASLGASLITVAASAQVVPPVPDKTPPSPAYEPPPPPPEPVQPAERPKPEPPKPLPSIVERDEGGAVIPLETTKPRAALLAFEYTEEEQAKVDAALEAYQKEVDKTVIENPGRVLAIRERAANLEEVSGLADIMSLSELYKGLPPLDLLRTAQNTGAISAVQRRRVENVIKEYEEAIKQELVARYDNEQDVYKLIDITGKQAFLERTHDLRLSLQRQVLELAPRLEELLKGLELSDDQRAEVENVLDMTTVPAPTKAWRVFEEVLSDEQRTAILRAASPEVFQEPKPAAEEASQPGEETAD